MSRKQLIIFSTLLLCVSALPRHGSASDEGSQREFCTAVSQFLESVTCEDHRPCLSLDLQARIANRCLVWRPEDSAMRSSISKDEEAEEKREPVEKGARVWAPPGASRAKEEEEWEWEGAEEGKWEWRPAAAAVVALGCVVWAARAFAHWRRPRVAPYGKHYGGWVAERKPA